MSHNHNVPRATDDSRLVVALPGRSNSSLNPRLASKTCAAIVVLAGLCAACGVPLDSADRPLPINKEVQVPETTTTTSTTTTPPVTTAVTPTTEVPTPTRPDALAYPLDLYLVSGFRVVPVRRSDSGADLPSAVIALRFGPRTEDLDEGLRSAISQPEMLVDATSQGGTITVQLDPLFLTLPGGEQRLALAQIVYTLTVLPGNGRVRFEVAGRRLAVPRANGQPTNAPVSRDDYASLVDQPAGTTTTTSIDVEDRTATTSL